MASLYLLPSWKGFPQSQLITETELEAAIETEDAAEGAEAAEATEAAEAAPAPSDAMSFVYANPILPTTAVTSIEQVPDGPEVNMITAIRRTLMLSSFSARSEGLSR